MCRYSIGTLEPQSTVKNCTILSCRRKEVPLSQGRYRKGQEKRFYTDGGTKWTTSKSP